MPVPWSQTSLVAIEAEQTPQVTTCVMLGEELEELMVQLSCLTISMNRFVIA